MGRISEARDIGAFVDPDWRNKVGPSIATSATDDLSGTPEVTSMTAGDKFQLQVDSLNAADQGNIGQLICRIVWTETIT